MAEAVAPAVQGVVSPGFEAVVAAFERNLIERGETGAAFAAYADGRPVVDLWGGQADSASGRPWARDSVAPIFSGTKGFVATCLVLLVQRGVLDLDAPVAALWPEFAAQGKDHVLVRHVVSHRAGLPGLATPVTLAEAADPVRMAELLGAQPLVSVPGERLSYHAMTFGWLCDALVRRVDGRGVAHVFREEVAAPLKLDAWIGLPAREQGRVATVERGTGFGTPVLDADKDPVAWSIWENPARFSLDPLPFNDAAWRAAELPASNGIAAARSVARLYGCLALGGTLDGVALLTPESVRAATTPLAAGVEPYLDDPMAFGVGFQLQSASRPFGPADSAFGHTGTGGSVHGAWPAHRAGFSYITNSLHRAEGADPRAAALLEALYDAVASRVDEDASHGPS